MSQTIVDPSASTDIFTDLYTSHNHNANNSIDHMVQVSNDVTFYTRTGGVFGTIMLPLSPNVIISGLVASSVLFALNTTAGTYQVANVQHSIGAGSFTIPAAHPTLNRVDVLVVDNTGGYVYLTGTPAVNPVAPSITLNQLAVTYITIPAAGNPNIGNPPCCIDNGVTIGNTLRWDGTKWTETEVLNMTTASTQFNNSASFSVFAGSPTLYGEIDASNGGIALLYSSGGTQSIFRNASTGFVFEDTGIERSVFFNIEGGLELKNATPTTTTNKLYAVGGDLYWDGAQVCIAPCSNNVDDGTIEDSTLRWDNIALQWLENPNFIADNDTKTKIMCTFSAEVYTVSGKNFFVSCEGSVATDGNKNIALNSKNLVFQQGGATTNGGNSLMNTIDCGITVLNTYKGYSGIFCSNDSYINHTSGTDTFTGFSAMIATANCVMQDNVQLGFIASGDSHQIENAAISTVIGGSNNTIIGSTFAPVINSVIIGGDSNNIQSNMFGQGAYNAIIGGTSNLILPTSGIINNSVIIGGTGNKVQGAAHNSAVIGSNGKTVDRAETTVLTSLVAHGAIIQPPLETPINITVTPNVSLITVSATGRTITLDNPEDGWRILICDITGNTNPNITVAISGTATIKGNATDVINTAYGVREYIYIASIDMYLTN